MCSAVQLLLSQKTPLGGVAVYKNKQLDAELDVISVYFRDCVVFKIRYTDLVIATMYIPPHNSEYYDNIYFKNFELLIEYFNNKHLIITGDLNSHVGILDETTTRFNYISNPDTNVNLNGKNLLGICSADFNFVMRNGFSNDIKTFDSKFTF